MFSGPKTGVVRRPIPGPWQTSPQPTDVANNYSRRLLGYLRPQTTGDYTFWIAGDDDCRLYLSTDGYEANKVQIAAVNGWTNFQVWDAMGSQESASIPLVAGKVYWIEAHHREGGGGDHVSVAWSGPGISRVAIPSTVMFQCVPGLAFAPPAPVFLVNTAPLVAGPADRVINVNTNTGAVAFTINDADSPIGALTVSATSDNLTLVPNGNIVLGGSGANRTVTVTPVANRLGTATITLTANDGSLQGSDTFLVNVVGTPQETWRFTHFGTTANTGSPADSGDPDGDSWTNGQEFILGTNPNASNAAALIITPAGSDVTLTFLARQATGPGYDGLTRFYDVQTNASLDGSRIMDRPSRLHQHRWQRSDRHDYPAGDEPAVLLSSGRASAVGSASSGSMGVVNVRNEHPYGLTS